MKYYYTKILKLKKKINIQKKKTKKLFFIQKKNKKFKKYHLFFSMNI